MPTQPDTPPAIGATLANGATVLQAKPTRAQMPCAIVLALWPESPDPFVTWLVRLDALVATSGYYFADLGEALADYEERG